MRRLGAVLAPRSSRAARAGRCPACAPARRAQLSTAERRDRRAGRAIGGDLGPVGDDVVADDVDVRHVVHREAAHAARPDRRAGEGAGLVFQHLLGGDDACRRFLAPIFTSMTAPEVGPVAAEHLLAAHHHLDRPAGLLRQRERHRLQIDQRLAAEAAADLGRDRRGCSTMSSAEQLGAVGADHELALAGAPDRAPGRRRRR